MSIEELESLSDEAEKLAHDLARKATVEKRLVDVANAQDRLRRAADSSSDVRKRVLDVRVGRASCATQCSRTCSTSAARRTYFSEPIRPAHRSTRPCAGS